VIIEYGDCWGSEFCYCSESLILCGSVYRSGRLFRNTRVHLLLLSVICLEILHAVKVYRGSAAIEPLIPNITIR